MYSNKTGRPERKSAGKSKAKDGYVDSSIIEDDYGDQDMMESSSGNQDENGVIKIPPKRKRKRSPSPTPPPLEQVFQFEDSGDDSDGQGSFQTKSKPTSIQIQLNFPPGFNGPLYVIIDRSMRGSGPRLTIGAARRASNPHSVHHRKRPLGFTDLPAELRNAVYRRLFVTDHVLQFPADRLSANKNTLKRSSQFLRTCKLVHNEGCSILYGENKFFFDRNGTTRGSFWEAVPKEIGYADVRLFLQVIGSKNLLYLREITLKLQDAMPGVTPDIEQDKRRYSQDDHLLQAIRTLRQTKLRKLNVIFLGRRRLRRRADTEFVDNLKQVKADEVVLGANGLWDHKIDPSLWSKLQNTMKRKKKLYPPEK